MTWLPWVVTSTALAHVGAILPVGVGAGFAEYIPPIVATPDLPPEVPLVQRLRFLPRGTPPSDWVVVDEDAARRTGRVDDGRVHVVFATDDHHLPGLAGGIRSAVANARPPEVLVFHAVVPKGSEKKAANYLACHNVTAAHLNLSVVGFDDAVVRDLIRVERGSRQDLNASLNYARFFLTRLLPKTVDVILYVDADIVIQGDLVRFMANVRAQGAALVHAVPRDQTFARAYHRPVVYRHFRDRYGFAVEPQVRGAARGALARSSPLGLRCSGPHV